jgi:hypothetical protein
MKVLHYNALLAKRGYCHIPVLYRYCQSDQAFGHQKVTTSQIAVKTAGVAILLVIIGILINNNYQWDREQNLNSI